MQFVQQLHFQKFLLTLLLIFSAVNEPSHAKPAISTTIVVDLKGTGNFASVQKAIDSIPPNSSSWTLIHVKAGIYTEKVTIPKEKPFIVLEGEGSRYTIIEFGDHGDAGTSTTFSAMAENFVARDISFRNTYDYIRLGNDGRIITWAPAFQVAADKASFYRVGFISLQDTLTDLYGRHYFNSCYIQGAIDFIWGFGQSIYERCIINVTTMEQGPGSTGFIAAQGRDSATNPSGYVFKYCHITGNNKGRVFLGRAYRQFSRVIYYKSSMTDIIKPEGWSAWDEGEHTADIAFSEAGCFGGGSNMSQRVKWEKVLSPNELNYFISKEFINSDGWIENQP